MVVNLDFNCRECWFLQFVVVIWNGLVWINLDVDVELIVVYLDLIDDEFVGYWFGEMVQVELWLYEW